MNGRKHGFTGHATVTTDEDYEAWKEFSIPYVEALKPIGPIEIQLARTLAIDNFRLNRLKAVEENMFAYGELGPLSGKIETEHPRVHHAIVQAQVFVVNDRAFQNLSLYEQRLTRAIHKNLKLLREEQALRKAEEKHKALLQAEPKPLTRSASGSDKENGFDFSTALSQVINLPETPKGPEADIKSRINAHPTMKNHNKIRCRELPREAPRQICLSESESTLGSPSSRHAKMKSLPRPIAPEAPQR
jgi:hypothetical protein